MNMQNLIWKILQKKILKMLLTIWITDLKAGAIIMKAQVDYSYGDDDYYRENEAELYYNDPDTPQDQN